MIKNALGLIEVIGLAAGVTAADAALKSANVELIGYEMTKGGGMTVVKVLGDVGAVNAAVDAGAAAAASISRVVSSHVIPRPASELEKIILTKETVGNHPTKPEPATTLAPDKSIEAMPDEKEAPPPNPGDICNLCGDPACPRKKGDPRMNCIHYQKTSKEDE